jgi:hypothetical protein
MDRVFSETTKILIESLLGQISKDLECPDIYVIKRKLSEHLITMSEDEWRKQKYVFCRFRDQLRHHEIAQIYKEGQTIQISM